jgi:hypothetical protein
MKLRNIFIILGIIVVIGLGFLAFQEFRRKPPIRNSYKIKPSGERVYKISETETGPGLALLKEATPTTPIISPTTTTEPINGVSPLFNKPLGFTEIDYPIVYAYDFETKTISAFNLGDKTYQQIYNQPTSGLLKVSFSQNKQQIALQLRQGVIDRYFLLDRVNDTLTELNSDIRDVFWFNNQLGYYLSDRGSQNYLAYLNRDREIKLADIALLEPVIEPAATGDIFITESPRSNRPTPLFLLRKIDLQIIFPSQMGLSAIPQKSGGYIFASYFKDGNWQSVLLTPTGNQVKSFAFGTFKEKCSFTTVLVCGVPLDQNSNELPSAWYEFRRSFIDKLFIFDPQKSQELWIELPGEFDVITPILTKAGIIFTNRFDSKLYLVPMKNLALDQSQ